MSTTIATFSMPATGRSDNFANVGISVAIAGCPDAEVAQILQRANRLGLS